MADNIYQRVTDSIVRSLENGVGSWKRPWTVKAGHGSPFPYNVASGANYRGINVVMLWCAREEQDYETHCWGTYDQWKERGAQVRKGEKATHIVFFKRSEYTTKNDAGDDEQRKSMIARGYYVFNMAQVDGYDPKPLAELPEVDRIAHAETFFENTGARVLHGGSRAFYVASEDYIQLPEINTFQTPTHYYSTRAHETAHWTGTEVRCDRNLKTRFGDEAYAMEELVAEVSAAFTCAVLGLDSEPRDDHAQYIASWLKVLKGDNKAIFTAASRAQKATDYLIGLQVEQEDMSENKLAA